MPGSHGQSPACIYLVALGHLKIAGSDWGMPGLLQVRKKYLQPCVKELQACRKPYSSSETQERCTCDLFWFVLWCHLWSAGIRCCIHHWSERIRPCVKPLIATRTWGSCIMILVVLVFWVAKINTSLSLSQPAALYSTICNSRLVSWCDVGRGHTCDLSCSLCPSQDAASVRRGSSVLQDQFLWWVFDLCDISQTADSALMYFCCSMESSWYLKKCAFESSVAHLVTRFVRESRIQGRLTQEKDKHEP